LSGRRVLIEATRHFLSDLALPIIGETGLDVPKQCGGLEAGRGRHRSEPLSAFFGAST
jgi:hypothetical protein